MLYIGMEEEGERRERSEERGGKRWEGGGGTREEGGCREKRAGKKSKKPYITVGTLIKDVIHKLLFPYIGREEGGREEGRDRREEGRGRRERGEGGKKLRSSEDGREEGERREQREKREAAQHFVPFSHVAGLLVDFFVAVHNNSGDLTKTIDELNGHQIKQLVRKFLTPKEEEAIAAILKKRRKKNKKKDGNHENFNLDTPDLEFDTEPKKGRPYLWKSLVLNLVGAAELQNSKKVPVGGYEPYENYGKNSKKFP
jgi:hypothetical protein